MTAIPNVPWMIEGGAKHTTQLARNLAFMAAGGAEGIVLGKHLEVRELDVPGAAVRVFPGTFAVQNRAAGATDELYVDSFSSELEVPIATTGVGETRSDLIVARIENPHASGETWPAPADPTVGPYASLAVISNVDPATTGVDDLGLSADHSMIPLARVDLPANTAAVTQAMIVDLRTMANAVSHREHEVFAPTTTDQIGGAFANWPAEVNMLVDVPEWATHVRVVAIASGVKVGAAGNNGGAGHEFRGDLRIKLVGSQTTTSSLTRVAGESAERWVRTTFVAAASKVKIPEGDRGRKGLSVRIEAQKTSGSADATSDNGVSVSLDVEFVNEPESNL